MVKRLLTILMLGGALSAGAQYQLANNGFENWEEVSYKSGLSTKKGDEPVKWSSFLDGTGTLKGTAGAVQLYKEENEKHSGSYSAKITARKVLTVIAQGNLTNGCINMGSMSPDDASGNYNYINENRDDQAMKFNGKPDAVKVWIKFNGSNPGSTSLVLVTKGYYQDPEANDITAKKVASAVNKTISSNNTWTEYTIPFKYEEGVEDRPYYAYAAFTTSATPGEGSASDCMYIDDVVMVYNSELASATYDGSSVSFVDGNASMAEVEFDENKLELTSNGIAATIEKSFNPATGVLTITVKGDDYSVNNSNYHTYTIQFKKLYSVVDSNDYDGNLLVTVNGYENPLMDTSVKVETLDNGNINFSLHNFLMELEGELTPIGHIDINNLEVIDNYFTFNGKYTISAGDPVIYLDGEAYELEPSDWLGPNLGELDMKLTGNMSDGKLYVTIQIALPGQDVDVIFGNQVSAVLNVTDAKWATFCAPFEVELPDGVEAYTIDGIESNGSTLTMSDPMTVVPAYQPVVLYSETSANKTYEGFDVAKDMNNGLLVGCLALTDVPANSYLLQNQEGVVGFYNVGNQALHVGANRCYLTAPDSAVKAYFFNEEADAINAVAVENDKEMFDLQGRKVMNAQKGIFIQNGKKVVK